MTSVRVDVAKPRIFSFLSRPLSRENGEEKGDVASPTLSRSVAAAWLFPGFKIPPLYTLISQTLLCISKQFCELRGMGVSLYFEVKSQLEET